MTGATKARIAAGAVGTAVLAYGVFGLLTEKDIGSLGSVLVWLAGGVVAHDAVLAPIVFAACALLWRFAGPRIRLRRALALFLVIAGPVTLVALPSLLRRGHNANPTVTALDYPRNLAITVAVVALAVGLFTVAGAARERHRRRVASGERRRRRFRSRLRRAP